MNADDKFKQEHSARLSDFFLTRRQFLNRASMGFGALSLAALFGERVFLNDAPAAEDAADSLLPLQSVYRFTACCASRAAATASCTSRTAIGCK